MYQLSTECHKERELEMVMDFRVVRKLGLKLGVQRSSLEGERRWDSSLRLPRAPPRSPEPVPLTARKAGPEQDSRCRQGLLTHKRNTRKEGNRVLRRGRGSGARAPDFLAL